MSIKHRIRSDGNGKTRIVRLTASKAVQLHCKECLGYQDQVKGCTDRLCCLYPFRTEDKPRDTVI